MCLRKNPNKVMLVFKILFSNGSEYFWRTFFQFRFIRSLEMQIYDLLIRVEVFSGLVYHQLIVDCHIFIILYVWNFNIKIFQILPKHSVHVFIYFLAIKRKFWFKIAAIGFSQERKSAAYEFFPHPNSLRIRGSRKTE